MLKRLDRGEMKEIFDTRMVQDFPPDELKPWKRIAEMLDEGVYFAYGLYEQSEVMAYAFFVVKGDLVLLDYYAVCKQVRGTGVGSRCMKLLKEELKKQGIHVMLAEVENPAYAGSAEEKATQERRIRFYEKNGFTLTETRSCLFSVEYKIMYVPFGEMGEEEVPGALDTIYHTMFPVKYLGREVVLYR